jgi:hypothetical protein
MKRAYKNRIAQKKTKDRPLNVHILEFPFAVIQWAYMTSRQPARNTM